jgi:NADH dehydrogenase FAD-containing subunit
VLVNLNKKNIDNITFINSNNKLHNVKTAILGAGLTGITLARLLHEKEDEGTVSLHDQIRFHV